jgi:MFS family permease
MGLGSIAGGLYTASRKNIKSNMLVNAAWLFGGTTLLAAIAPSFLLALGAMFLVGFCSIIFLSTGNTILQLESDPSMRGRVMSLWTMAFLGSTPIGGPIIGFIGEHIGPRWGLAVGGFAALIAAGIGTFQMINNKKTPPN